MEDGQIGILEVSLDGITVKFKNKKVGVYVYNTSKYIRANYLKNSPLQSVSSRRNLQVVPPERTKTF